MSKNRENTLFSIANKQMGFFTAQQAEFAGYRRANFAYYVREEKWIKEDWGIYRLRNYPQSDLENLMRIYLWSRNKEGIPRGIFSHDTALNLYQLSDWVSNQIHLTMPKKDRKVPQKGVIIHKSDISEEEITEFEGMRITTPLKTLLDIIEEKSISEEFIEQAVKGAYKQGLILQKDFKKHPILGAYIV